ncbi:hypothetical protein [Leuconostoc pseudomesenteroides]|uniref:hypothetical protein n=1 Tax=Leuconostoc pseudomesenteroides TaxID=33968 RepID=UPI001662FCD8|nr:hypothetical protein [Leuconostoc pseudomesenteroides]
MAPELLSVTAAVDCACCAAADELAAATAACDDASASEEARDAASRAAILDEDLIDALTALELASAAKF